MQFASAMSREVQTAAAVAEVLDNVASRLSDQSAHLSLVFASPHHLKDFPHQLQVMQERLSSHTLIGCTGGGVIGDQQEVEQRPGLSLMAAHLPGVTITPFHIEQPELEQETSESHWHERLGLSPDDQPTFILLPDPLRHRPTQTARRVEQRLSPAPCPRRLGQRRPVRRAVARCFWTARCYTARSALPCRETSCCTPWYRRAASPSAGPSS